MAAAAAAASYSVSTTYVDTKHTTHQPTKLSVNNRWNTLQGNNNYWTTICPSFTIFWIAVIMDDNENCPVLLWIMLLCVLMCIYDLYIVLCHKIPYHKFLSFKSEQIVLKANILNVRAWHKLSWSVINDIFCRQSNHEKYIWQLNTNTIHDDDDEEGVKKS